MAKRYFWPNRLAEQVQVIRNFDVKIDEYTDELGFTESELAEIHDVCQIFIAAYEYAASCKIKTNAIFDWRNEIFRSKEPGKLLSAPPTFALPPAVEFTSGVVDRFLSIRENLVTRKGYTTVIGLDLGIIGSEITPESRETLFPEVKVAALAEFSVRLNGKMQGMDAMRVEYAKKDGEFEMVAILTKTPATLHIKPSVAGDAEAGTLRFVFMKDNAKYGVYSPEYPITLS